MISCKGSSSIVGFRTYQHSLGTYNCIYESVYIQYHIIHTIDMARSRTAIACLFNHYFGGITSLKVDVLPVISTSRRSRSEVWEPCPGARLVSP